MGVIEGLKGEEVALQRGVVLEKVAALEQCREKGEERSVEIVERGEERSGERERYF